MVRPAQLIQKTVFLSVTNPLTQMTDTQAWVQQACAREGASSLTGMVLAGSDRWLCLLEGEQLQVDAMTRAIQLHVRPREWHVLMTDSRAKTRLFPQQRVGWRPDCTLLEMAAFLSDLRRYTSRSQLWHINDHQVAALLEPGD
jgi:Sensors of blue-light using FAD